MEGSLITEVREIFDQYIADTLHIENERKPGDGLLGFGRSPAQDPCHDVFADRLQKVLSSEEAKVLPSADIAELLEFIFKAPIESQENTLAYWMLIAIQALTKDLIRRLTPEDASPLWTQYKEMYPRRSRLPVQNDIAALLNFQAGGKSGLLRIK